MAVCELLQNSSPLYSVKQEAMRREEGFVRILKNNTIMSQRDEGKLVEEAKEDEWGSLLENSPWWLKKTKKKTENLHKEVMCVFKYLSVSMLCKFISSWHSFVGKWLRALCLKKIITQNIVVN